MNVLVASALHLLGPKRNSPQDKRSTDRQREREFWIYSIDNLIFNKSIRLPSVKYPKKSTYSAMKAVLVPVVIPLRGRVCNRHLLDELSVETSLLWLLLHRAGAGVEVHSLSHR